MEESRKKIQKMAKFLSVIAKIIIGIMVFLCIIMALLLVAGLIVDESDTYETIIDTLDSFGATNIVSGKAGYKTTIIVGTIVFLVTRIVIIIFALMINKIFSDIAKGGQPFTKENSKKIFIISMIGLLFVFVSILTTLIVVALGVFISQLFKYGAYLNEKAEETNKIQESMIVSFAEVVENKSEQTGQHVRRVAEYSKILAKEMGYSDEDCEKIKLASMMHDIGKLMVPSEILEKPGRLTDDEFKEIKNHPDYGAKLLNDVEGDVLVLAKRIAREHHERFDGRGYPDGLGASNISMEGRIVAVCDVYDALTSKRSYKDAWNEKDAYNEIVKNSGTQFDEKVVEAFKNTYDKINDIRLKFQDQI